VLVASSEAVAQSTQPAPPDSTATPSAPPASTATLPSAPQPYSPSGLPSAPQPYTPQPYSPPPMTYQPGALSYADASALNGALAAVKAGDYGRAESYRGQISDAIAQRIVRWAEVDQLGRQLSFLELDGARRDLSGWPRGPNREAWAEMAMGSSSMDPDRTIAWFDGAPPVTPEGAMALAGALQAKGRLDEAKTLIKAWWTTRVFDFDPQSRMYARFGSWLDTTDHAKRLDTLLLGPRGPALDALLPLLDADHRLLAAANIALRNGSYDANARVAEVPASLAHDPALAYEHAHYLRDHGMDTLGFRYVPDFPAVSEEDLAEKLWLERRNYFNAAIRARDWNTAYAAMNNTGFTSGEKLVESQFFAGWVALTKLHNPQLAATNFEAMQKSSSTPITQGRASYWLGRAAEAKGDAAAAAGFYQTGEKYITSFYGQLAAEKAGMKAIVLPKDPIPTQADRDRFEARQTVRAARMLSQIGNRELFRSFVLSTAETLPSAEEMALLVDLARYSGDPDLSLRVVRIGAQHGFILAERGYPVLSVPETPGSAEAAFALSIARQESNFWPEARSNANARGIMQLEPATARRDAAKLGIPWSEASLYDAQYNMRLGAFELGQLIAAYGGSYVMASAGYNAGPTRPPQWASECGDPRGGSTDPLDFIECIPFSETRNYVMRTLETTEIYRARLNNGTGPLAIAEDLKRGSYGFTSNLTTVASTDTPPGGPVPYAQAPTTVPVIYPEPPRSSYEPRCTVRHVHGHGRHAKVTYSACSHAAAARYSAHHHGGSTHGHGATSHHGSHGSHGHATTTHHRRHHG
jgi:soluble lytic murein transglycosylase